MASWVGLNFTQKWAKRGANVALKIDCSQRADQKKSRKFHFGGGRSSFAVVVSQHRSFRPFFFVSIWFAFAFAQQLLNTIHSQIINILFESWPNFFGGKPTFGLNTILTFIYSLLPNFSIIFFTVS